WTPLAADYTRFARDRRSAFAGAGIGYFLPTLCCFALGAVLVLERNLSDPAQIPNAVASGSVLAVVALLMLTVDESDEAFADVYSTAVSLQNLLPRASQRMLIVVVASVATAGAIAIDLGNYLTFLFLLGSLFVPPCGARPPVRRPARGLARARRALRRAGHLQRPGGALGAPRGLGRWLRALSMALASRAELVDGCRRARRARARAADGVAAELRGRLRADAARSLDRFGSWPGSARVGTLSL